MFTGIVAALGSVRRLTRQGGDARIEIETGLDLGDVRVGDSIAVSGACLTVTALAAGGFTADVSAETLFRTTLGGLKGGDRVHLEKALRLGDRLGGHIVLGHVDGVGRVVVREARSGSVVLGIEVPPELDRYLVVKGSVTVDGVSLTVNRCEKNRFYVNIIPHTAAETTLPGRGVGDGVNIETDILARHVEKLLAAGAAAEADGQGGAPAGGIDLALLARHGFLK